MLGSSQRNALQFREKLKNFRLSLEEMTLQRRLPRHRRIAGDPRRGYGRQPRSRARQG